MLQGVLLVSGDLSKNENGMEVTVDGTMYIVEKNFLLGLAVTKKGNIYPLGEWNVAQGYIEEIIDE